MAIERDDVNEVVQFLRIKKFTGEDAILEVARDLFPDLGMELLAGGGLAVWDRDDEAEEVEVYCVTIARTQ